jgi:hypothetical protein
MPLILRKCFLDNDAKTGVKECCERLTGFV